MVLQKINYEDVLKRYHFRRTDLEQLTRLGDEALFAVEPMLYAEACTVEETEDGLHVRKLTWKNGESVDMRDQKSGDPIIMTESVNKGISTAASLDAGTAVAVIVSLGGGIDALQDAYESCEQLTEAYMIECIAMELLKNAYELAAERLHAICGLWMDGFGFLGERYPIEMMEDIFKLLSPKGISYNSAYMLTPKKTVVFMTTLQQERRDSYCRVCGQCSNLGCPNRQTEKLNYGYQKIFGKP